jgi:dihydrolipoamide dehydrogenase
MADKYKLVVIGAGPGGYVAALRAAQLGIKTAIVEKEYLGGVCLNWGCIPSKALLYTTELKRTIEDAERIGLKAENVTIDLDKLKKHRDDTVKRLVGGVKFLLEKAGVEVIMGEASFVDSGKIEVSQNGKKGQIEADNFIIATGTSTASLPVLKIDNETIIGARKAIELPSIPKRLGVIGAGPIGVEMATVYNTLGSEVTVIELMDSVLPMLDDDISTGAERAYKKQGMKIFTDSRVESAEKTSGGIDLKVKTPAGEEKMTFDTVLVAVGMTPKPEPR